MIDFTGHYWANTSDFQQYFGYTAWFISNNSIQSHSPRTSRNRNRTFDWGKYQATLTITFDFVANIWNFDVWNNVKTYLKHDNAWKIPSLKYTSEWIEFWKYVYRVFHDSQGCLYLTFASSLRIRSQRK